MQAFHWELERGLAAVALAQKHMTSLEKELAAGRMSTALVIVKVCDCVVVWLCVCACVCVLVGVFVQERCG